LSLSRPLRSGGGRGQSAKIFFSNVCAYFCSFRYIVLIN
jgi:hypothetical protein